MTDLIESQEGHSLSDLARDILAEDDQEGVAAYLGQAWLSHTISVLVAGRRHAGLSQEEVAARMNTKQPVISRLENDFDGSCSLHRYLAYAHAVGMQPLDIALEPLGSVCVYAHEDPDAPRTQLAYETWRVAHRSQSGVSSSRLGELLTAQKDFIKPVSYSYGQGRAVPCATRPSAGISSNGTYQGLEQSSENPLGTWVPLAACLGDMLASTGNQAADANARALASAPRVPGTEWDGSGSERVVVA